MIRDRCCSSPFFAPCSWVAAPGRPVLLFLFMYFFKMGFLDGRAGLIYCTLRAIYEYMIDLKVKELRRREKGLPI